MAVPTHLEPAALCLFFFYTDLHPCSSISDTSCHFFPYPGIYLHLSIAMNTMTGYDASMYVLRVLVTYPHSATVHAIGEVCFGCS